MHKLNAWLDANGVTVACALLIAAVPGWLAWLRPREKPRRDESHDEFKDRLMATHRNAYADWQLHPLYRAAAAVLTLAAVAVFVLYRA